MSIQKFCTFFVAPATMVVGVLVSRPVQAFHQYRKGLDELLGPTSWGIYIVVPAPFIVAGIIGYLIWRAMRADADQDSDTEIPDD